MNASTAIVLVLILVIAVFACRRMFRVFFGTSDCCGGGGGGGAKAKRVRVADTDEAHYPYVQDVQVGGMTCPACANAVENALNALGDTWARVDVDAGSAHVLSKRPLDAEEIRDAVAGAGYYMARR